MIAEVVEVFADGLGGNLEAAHQIIDHHPADSAGEVEYLSLAMGQAGHDSTSGEEAHGAAIGLDRQRAALAHASPAPPAEKLTRRCPGPSAPPSARKVRAARHPGWQTERRRVRPRAHWRTTTLPS